MSAEGLHVNEAPGMDLLADEDGCWRDLLGRAEGEDDVEEEKGDDEMESDEPKKPVRRRRGKREPAWRVDAGPIDHRSTSSSPGLMSLLTSRSP